MQLLFSKGANVNLCDHYKENPLLKASEIRHESIIELLLNKEADINLCNKYRKTPLHKSS